MEEERRAPQPPQVPGCGMAAFALLLLTIFVVGIIGISVSTYSVFTAGEALSPQKLSYGGLVEPIMLAPMRASGVLGPTEIPDAFHAENADGSRACAISAGKLLRVEDGVGSTLALDDVTEVREEPDAVVVVAGDKSVRCPFGEGQGGDRFARMIRNR